MWDLLFSVTWAVLKGLNIEDVRLPSPAAAEMEGLPGGI